jgi:anti-sigma factor RsiW
MSHAGELISAYLDGELAKAEIDQLQTHLATCGKCAAELQEIQVVRSAVRSLPLLELPAGLIPEADAEVVPLRRNKGFWVGAAAAAVAVVIAIAAIVTPSTPSVALEELNSRYGARASLDPAFGPAKMVVPDLGDILE